MENKLQCKYCKSLQDETEWFVTENLCLSCYNQDKHLTGTMIENNNKRYPVVTGCLDYFPDAIKAVAECSLVGNEQHNPGEPLDWNRAKSGDEADSLARHLMARGAKDIDGIRHSTKVAWRALALLQKEIEREKFEKKNILDRKPEKS